MNYPLLSCFIPTAVLHYNNMINQFQPLHFLLTCTLSRSRFPTLVCHAYHNLLFFTTSGPKLYWLIHTIVYLLFLFLLLSTSLCNLHWLLFTVKGPNLHCPLTLILHTFSVGRFKFPGCLVLTPISSQPSYNCPTNNPDYTKAVIRQARKIATIIIKFD